MKLLHLNFFLIFFFISSANAEFLCKAEVWYKWKKSSEEEESKSLWIVVEKTAEAEEKAKQGLADIVAREKERALEACRLLHESEAKCAATKYSTLSTTLQSLSFSARKSLEEAITKECSIQQGRCIEALSPEPHCIDLATKSGEGEEGSGKEGGKEEKGKKKK